MNEEVRALVNEGLFYDNLLKLVDLCDARFDTNPSVYGSLSHIFQKLSDEYDGQEILTERYETIMRALQAPMHNLLIAVEEDDPHIIDRLDDVWRTFGGVSY